MAIFRRNTRAVTAPKVASSLQAARETGYKAGDTPKEAGIIRLASVVIAVTFQRLIEDAHREWSLEEELVLQALRRSTRTLETADAGQLGEYLRSLSDDQLRGVASGCSAA